MKKAAIVMTILGVLTVLTGVVACSSGNSSSEEAAIREYADPAATTTMEGLSENNRAKYIENGNQEFKDAVTQEVFDSVVSQINEQLGSFESIEFLSTEELQGYIRVHYKAKFAKAEVGLLMVFDQDHNVAGQFFE